MPYKQLIIPGFVYEDKTFSNFFAGNKNLALVKYLEKIASNSIQDKYIFLYSANNPGKTHLLYAICNEAQKINVKTIYIPLKKNNEFSSEILDAAEEYDIICLDDIDSVYRDDAWERRIFMLYNDMQNKNSKLIVTSNINSFALDLNLTDLKSRLQSFIFLKIEKLSDEEQTNGLYMIAENSGLNINYKAIQYVQNICKMDFYEAVKLLDKAKVISMEKSKKLTIPFIRKFLL